MGQTEGKTAQHPNATDPAESPPVSPNVPISSTTQHDENTQQNADTHGNSNPNNTNTPPNTNLPNTNTPPNDGRVGGTLKSNAEVLKRSTDELVGGINKLGANLISTAKGANMKYTSVSAIKKAATAAVEDAIVTVKAGIVKADEEPELEAVGKMPLFFPLIRSSVPISDLAKGLPVQKTTISYLDPRSILVSLLDYQRFLVVTSKMIAARQAELINKVKDAEMSSGRKVLFTLAMKATDMRHFNTQFSEVARFHTNMERTKQSINDLLGMFEKLNAILPTEEQLEPFPVFATSNPTISSHSSRNYSTSPHSSLNFASLNLPASHSSLKNFFPTTSHSSGKFPSHSSMNYATLVKEASLAPLQTTTSHTTTSNVTTTSNSTTSNTTNPSTIISNPNSETTNQETTNSETTNPETTNAEATNAETTNSGAPTAATTQETTV